MTNWRHPRLDVLCAVALLFSARLAHAQVQRGVVSDSGSGRPIAGVVVMLFDSLGAQVSRGLTNGAGAFVLSPDRPVARVRLQRIGFRPRDYQLPHANRGELEQFTMAALPTLLESVHVTASTCRRQAKDESAIALLEQARSGLLAAVVAREAKPASMLRLIYEKRMNDDGDRTDSMTVRIDSMPSTASFRAALSGHDFARYGFAASDGVDRTFFGPDPEVVLDDGFISAYCFRIVKDQRDRPRQVGLGFAPADRKRDRIDIDGVLWVDTSARVLRDIEFRYVGFDRALEALRPGGAVSFQAMPNGIVLIDRWNLRLVGVATDTSAHGRVQQRLFPQMSGGELARAVWRDGTSFTDSLGALRLHLVTGAGAPAAGTEIVLAGTEYRARADARGDVIFPYLIPGPYKAMVLGERLSTIGVPLPVAKPFVAERGVVSEQTARVATAEDYAWDLCRADNDLVAGDTTFLVGRVVDRRGKPVDDAHVSFEFQDSQSPSRWIPSNRFYRTGTNGLFHFCPKAIRSYGVVRLFAQVGWERSQLLEVTLTEGAVVVRLPFDR